MTSTFAKASPMPYPPSRPFFPTPRTASESLSWLVITFFLVLYMLVDGADHLKAIRRLFPKHARLEATNLFNAIAQANRGWALASCANVISASLLLGTGLYLLSVPGAWLLGIFAGLGELIPNIGPILGAIPALLLTLIADPDKFPYVLGMFIIVQTISVVCDQPAHAEILHGVAGVGHTDIGVGVCDTLRLFGRASGASTSGRPGRAVAIRQPLIWKKTRKTTIRSMPRRHWGNARRWRMMVPAARGCKNSSGAAVAAPTRPRPQPLFRRPPPASITSKMSNANPPPIPEF